MSEVSQRFAELALAKLADIDPGQVSRLIRRGDPGMLQRLIKREEMDAAAAGRRPNIPENLQRAVAPRTPSLTTTPGGPEVVRGARLGARPVPQAPRAAARQSSRSTAMAGIKDLAKHGPKSYLGRIGLTGLAIGGAIGAVEGARRVHTALTYKRDYENMLDFAPEIKNFDAKQVKARFDTLRKFNPEMSSDPLVASSWIKQTIEYPVVTPATLRDVVSRQRGGFGVGEAAKLLPSIEKIEPFA